MPGIHQLVAGFANGDAISNEARLLRAMFRRWGRESHIYCETRRVPPELRRESVDSSLCLKSLLDDDILLLHLSMGSDVNEIFRRANCRKVLLYHNITPPSFFRLINPTTAAQLERGLAQAASLAGTAAVNLADSAFNAGEITAIGYKDVSVFPLAMELDAIDHSIGRSTLASYDDGAVNILFVGRCAPNKKLEDILIAFAFFQKYVEPHSRLIHVGSDAGAERYKHLLLARVRELNLRNVVFAGALPQPTLNAIYATAHLFLCMSEHEGFCIPLLEAMSVGLPVMAYAAAAVPETMDGAGVLFFEKKYELIAETMGRIVSDHALRNGLLSRQHERVARFRATDPESDLKRHLAQLMP